MNKENIKHRIEVLQAKHKDLDERINVLYAERVDEKYITNLKKEKLQIKEEISKLEKEFLVG